MVLTANWAAAVRTPGLLHRHATLANGEGMTVHTSVPGDVVSICATSSRSQGQRRDGRLTSAPCHEGPSTSRQGLHVFLGRIRRCGTSHAALSPRPQPVHGSRASCRDTCRTASSRFRCVPYRLPATLKSKELAPYSQPELFCPCTPPPC